MEARYFFNRTIAHKIGKVFIVYFFFVTVFFAVGGLFCLKFHYNKLVKYFTEEYNKISAYYMML